MISGLKDARCPTEDTRRRSRAGVCAAAGFSMIELLAVGAILLLLFVLYWAPRTTTNRDREAQKGCEAQLQKIYVALSIYANDHAGTFPQSTGALTSGQALDALVPRYTVDTTMFICPGSKDAPVPGGESIRQRKISYAYYMGRRATDGSQALMSDQQVDTRSKTAGAAAFSSTGKPPANNHDKLGGNFLFCDGTTVSTPPRIPFSLTLTQGVILLNPTSQ
jgi:competence protein ComGC